MKFIIELFLIVFGSDVVILNPSYLIVILLTYYNNCDLKKYIKIFNKIKNSLKILERTISKYMK